MKTPQRVAVAAAIAFGAAMGATTATAGDMASGEKIFSAGCVNCHGKAGQGMASFPSLKGRDADYITQRLTAYRARESVGPNSALMYSWASKLSDEDIAGLANYISTSFQ